MWKRDGLGRHAYIVGIGTRSGGGRPEYPWIQRTNRATSAMQSTLATMKRVAEMELVHNTMALMYMYTSATQPETLDLDLSRVYNLQASADEVATLDGVAGFDHRMKSIDSQRKLQPQARRGGGGGPKPRHTSSDHCS